MKFKYSALILFVIFQIVLTKAQSNPITLDGNIKGASLIVEAKVVSSESFKYGEDFYTKHKLDIRKIFKGIMPDYDIYVITCGGQVGNEGAYCTHTVSLQKKLLGIFFLIPSIDVSKKENFQVYNSTQGGVLRYQTTKNGIKIAKGGFRQNELELVSEIEKRIQSVTGQSVIDLTLDKEEDMTKETGIRYTVKNFFFT